MTARRLANNETTPPATLAAINFSNRTSPFANETQRLLWANLPLF